MTAIFSRASLFSSSNRQIRAESCIPVTSNRCRSVKSRSVRSRCSLSLSRSDFYGRRIVAQRPEFFPKRWSFRVFSVRAQGNGALRIGNAPKWWEKGLQPNMKEVTSAQDLVDSLSNAVDKLVIVDFFSPGCGGCRALHPKICQLAETNPDIQFLQVNYEKHKSMCYSLNVHVLPFFRFYRGANGRVCSFSCTNATIKKFKDALAKYSPDQCSISPTKGLEEKELLALAANKDLSFNYTPKPNPVPAPAKEELIPKAKAAPSNSDSGRPRRFPLPASPLVQETEKKNVVNSGR